MNKSTRKERRLNYNLRSGVIEKSMDRPKILIRILFHFNQFLQRRQLGINSDSHLSIDVCFLLQKVWKLVKKWTQCLRPREGELLVYSIRHLFLKRVSHVNGGKSHPVKPVFKENKTFLKRDYTVLGPQFSLIMINSTFVLILQVPSQF